MGGSTEGPAAAPGLEVWRAPRGELDRRAAALVATALAERLRTAPTAVLGLVGGRSVSGIYRELQRAEIAWERVHLFLADERLVPPDSRESNQELVRADLVEPLVTAGRLPRANFHPFPTPSTSDRAAADHAAASYGAALAQLGGRFDAAVLSAGEDGHVASLFPGRTLAEGHGGSFLIVEDAPKPPPRRASASSDLLERTGLGVLAFYGAGKREALARFLDPDLPPASCPAKVALAMARLVVLVDEPVAET